jgi:hypothetical protein
MKKSMILVFLQLSLASLCSAQLINSVEIKAGVSKAKIINKKGDGILTGTSFRDIFTPEIGLDLAINGYTRLDSQLYFGTGIHYVEISYKHQLCCLLTGGSFPNFSLTSFKNKVQITSIGIPLLVRYDLGKKKKLAQFIGGLTLYKSFNGISNAEVQHSGDGPIDPVFNDPNAFPLDGISNKVNISAQLGFRGLLPIGKRSHLSLGGKVEYWFLPDEYYYAKFRGNILSYGGLIGYMIKI